ncbi:MAG: phosphoribosyltransferase regulatory subunit [Clostridiales bacterium]|nr:phosphoribosyltransferase regulatory subunit [Clostridiales bacterium]
MRDIMKHTSYQLLHTPEGVRDIYNGECERKIRLQQDMEEILKSYGYQSIQTPSFEFFDIFNEERGTVSQKELYKFIDREGNTLVLRPDMTPSIARCAAKYFCEDPFPLRLQYTGNTFINNSSHQGKLNETSQVGAELMNDASVEADSEILAITVDCLKRAGLLEFQVEVGHADFFNGLMEEAAFDEDEILEMKSLMESKNLFGIESLLERKELPQRLKELLMRLPELFGNAEHFTYARKMTNNRKALIALDRLEEILSIMDGYGMRDYITVDLGMLSKYNYYTGIIMKAYTYGTGEAIAQGGRYDNLVGQFGKDTPAVGLVLQIDQLMLALFSQKRIIPEKQEGILLFYRRSNRNAAIAFADVLRKQKKNVTMCYQKEGTALELYHTYAKRSNIRYILTLEPEDMVTVYDKETEQTIRMSKIEYVGEAL